MSEDSVPLAQLAARTAADARILALIAPTVAGLGYDLVRVRLMGGKSPRSPLTLQVMAEKPDGTMDVEGCAQISEALSALLDVEDPIEREYALEVSSPGIDRPLTRVKDFAAYLGHEGKFEMGAHIEGRKRFRGLIVGLLHAGEAVEIEAVDSKGTVERVALALADMADARLVMTDELIALSQSRLPPVEGDAETEAEAEAVEDAPPAPAASRKGSPQKGARKPRGDA
ncbi:ribosome maturation factor RimP [Neomegalonema sp.]|uniref:ribosome maturation factor RimP n=1 Tax=Neomegalonema sp. TaxID=2039713 RepID=UPI00260BA70B|nr:ribosome maturation factor RimP [Neomegalonema sp.]MDD2869425.1 ribosome maturation factor RimP [Neomegalonema sp.]